MNPETCTVKITYGQTSNRELGLDAVASVICDFCNLNGNHVTRNKNEAISKAADLLLIKCEAFKR